MHRRQRLFRKSQVKNLAAVPGTLIAPQSAPKSVITIIAFDEHDLVEKTLESPEDVQPLLQKWPVVWINVYGLGSTDVLEKFGDMFNLHLLAQEAVLNVHHRPKIEEYDNHLHMIVKMASIRDNLLDVEQLSFFIGENFLLTFQELLVEDVFAPVRQRLRRQDKRKYFMKYDYLSYALVDAIIDGYFPVLEHYTDKLNELEDIVVGNPDTGFVERIHDLKRDLQVLRHSIWPMREVLNKLSGDLPFIRDETAPFFRNCYDHVIQVVDILETYRERAAGLTDLYLSSLSYKMNEVIKVLTIIATIFMPLGFIAGVYGMNFDQDLSPFNMPELRWYFGYPFALGLMATFAAGLLWYFARKGWLGKND